MRSKRFFIITAAAVLLAVWVHAATGGLAGDPAVSLSYLTDTWLPGLLNNVSDRIIQRQTPLMSKLESTASGGIPAAELALSREGYIKSAAESSLWRLQTQGRFLFCAGKFTQIQLAKDQMIYGDAGTLVVLTDGGAVLTSGTLVNLTAGAETGPGVALLQNTEYLVAETGAQIRASASARVMVNGFYGLSSTRYVPQYYDLANALKSIGLVRGAASGFELGRSSTRAEAVTMLIRLLAEEGQSASSQNTHPFTDIDAWAQSYIGYAYQKGYAAGVAPTRFGASDVTSANHYMTFLLRTLGYNDSRGDFRWDSAMDSAVKFGVITRAEYDMLLSAPFYRDQMIYLSYYALFAKNADGGFTLLDKLVSSGAVDRESADSAIAKVTRKRPE